MNRLLRAGIDAAQAGRTEEAIKMLSRVIQKEPRSAEAWFWLGMAMPEEERKIDCFRRAMKFDPDYYEAREQLEKLGYLKPAAPKKDVVPAFSFDEPEEEVSLVFDEKPSDEKGESVFSFEEPEEAMPVFSFEETEEESVPAFSFEEPEEALPVFGQDLPNAPTFDETPQLPASTPVSTSPFSESADGGAFQNYYEEELDGKESSSTVEGLDFMTEVDNDDGGGDEDLGDETPEKPTGKGRKIALIVLGVLAFFAVAGVIAIFAAQPTMMSDVISAIIPPTSTPTPSPTATPTTIPTPTPLPFSALERGAYAPVFEPAECSFDTPAGQKVHCGFVIVPENRYGDVTKTIRLAVAIYRGKDYAAPPIIYLQGGPGQPTVELMSEAFDRSISSYVGKQDFILLDQRGIGLSEPNLDCPKLDEVYEDDFSNKIPDDEKEERYLAAFGNCRDRLTEDGINLSSYNTMENAADVKDVIVALGYERATLFGVSYGTRLAQVVMRENPEVVYSAVLDSVLPIEAKVYNESSTVAQVSLDTLFEGCAADRDCQRAYPALEGDLREVVNQLEKQPLKTNIFGYDENDYSHSVDGVDFMSAILWGMRDPNLQDIIPQAIGRAKSGEINVLSFILSLPMDAVNDINLGTYLSINCREQVYASTPKEVGEDLASYPDTEAVGLSWVYGDPNFIFSLCDTWRVEGIRPGENDAVFGDIPTLVMAGEYDSTTPPFWAEKVAGNLSNATYVEFLAQGHGVAFSQDSACPQKILKSFFANPETIPDTSCVAEMPPPEFATPYTGETPLIMIPVVNKDAGVITTAPANWTASEEDPAAFTREASLWDMTSISAQKVGLDFDSVMGALVGDYDGIGLDSYPMQVGEVEANDLTWKLYKTTLIALPVDIAFARDGYSSIIVIFLSHADEHDILYKEVFLEVLNETSLIPSNR